MMAPAGRKEKVADKSGDIKKSSYYVWFLGAKESSCGQEPQYQ